MKSCIFAILLLATVSVFGQSTNLFNWAFNNGTNSSSVVAISNMFVPSQTFTIQFGPITNAPFGDYTVNGITNSQAALWQISIDGANSNWITLGRMVPRGTNGEYRVFTLPAVSTAFAQRILLVTTNPLQMGIWKN